MGGYNEGHRGSLWAGDWVKEGPEALMLFSLHEHDLADKALCLTHLMAERVWPAPTLQQVSNLQAIASAVWRCARDCQSALRQASTSLQPHCTKTSPLQSRKHQSHQRTTTIAPSPQRARTRCRKHHPTQVLRSKVCMIFLSVSK